MELATGWWLAKISDSVEKQSNSGASDPPRISEGGAALSFATYLAQFLVSDGKCSSLAGCIARNGYESNSCMHASASFDSCCLQSMWLDVPRQVGCRQVFCALATGHSKYTTARIKSKSLSKLDVTCKTSSTVLPAANGISCCAKNTIKLCCTLNFWARCLSRKPAFKHTDIMHSFT